MLNDSPSPTKLMAALAAIAGLSLSIAGSPLAQPLELGLPVACPLGELCFLQTYPDQDPSDGYQDYLCGRRAYNGHNGTDIRVPTLKELDAGIPVVAAADGVVLATRDGMPDVFHDEAAPELVRNREAGNGIVISHGQGWVTQYSHLKSGSVRVSKGDRLRQGDIIGEIGLSGSTEFPHVEFAVRHNKKHIDPFTGTLTETACGEARSPLWTPSALAALGDVSGGLLKAGFSSRALETREIVGNRLRGARPSLSSDALVFWALSYNLREGDIEYLGLLGADGGVLAENSREIPRAKAQWLGFVGKRGDSWPAGTYEGIYRLFRKGVDGRPELLEEKIITLELP